ncbi:MAG: ribonuclease J [Angelakisella sp.]|nr:ribonuclease J [Angelakisella sp.]
MAQIGKKPAEQQEPQRAAEKPAQPPREKQPRGRGQKQPQAAQQSQAMAEVQPEQQPRRQQRGQGGQRQQRSQTPPPAQNDQGRQKDRQREQRPRRGKALMENSTLMLAPESVKCPMKRGTHQLKPGRPTLRIISLGGLGEIGKNITVYECGEDILIVDCGLAFPDDDLLGVDMVIPDFTYLTRNRDKIRGVFLTHGHEDHIGGLPYLLREIGVPVYGTALTLGLVEGKLREHGLVGKVRLAVVRPGETIKAGCMAVEFIHVNHSIPDACALAVHTPDGVVIQTGDYKIDYTPIESEVIDLVRFGELGSQGVLALLADSTNAEKPGSTPSERIVGDSFDKLFKNAGSKRIIIATFASNIHRIQQIIDAAVKTGRKVAVFGRSMLNVVSVATQLGYLTVKPGTIIDVEQMRSYTDEQLVVVCTGSQGEPMSALSRMSTGDHRQVRVGPSDYIILSATPIPGNEKLVGNVVNDLMKLGADVIYERMYDVHVSGHACQDETKMILSLTRPKYFVPVHGEYKHLMKNAGVARSMGMERKNIIISDIGRVIETDGVNMRLNGTVPSGRVLVDGLGVGDVGSVVLRDRKLLAEEGLIVVAAAIDGVSGEVVAGPDLVSRGFVYVRENEEMMEGARRTVLTSLSQCKLTGYRDWSAIKNRIRDDLADYIYARTRRRPMILPVLEEVNG